jgi:GNAT superfamily N-acetyltransferase
MKTTSNQPAIRKANLQDVAALKMCIDRAYAPVKQRLKDLPDVSGDLEEEIANKHVFITEIGDTPAACAVLSLDGEKAHLANVAVDPNMKGQGLGRLMMNFVEEFARQQGSQEICLATHIKMPENVELYRHLGWHETSRTGNKILMRKEL